MKYISNSVDDTLSLSEKIAQEYKDRGGIIYLHGDLGSGKTTFTSGFTKSLGITNKIVSPTFTIIKQYNIPNSHRMIYHIDLYRIEGKTSINELGLDEILYNKDHIVLIEWPEKMIKAITNKKDIYFKYLSLNKREIIIK